MTSIDISMNFEEERQFQSEPPERLRSILIRRYSEAGQLFEGLRTTSRSFRGAAV
jgi:hypothetical protein